MNHFETATATEQQRSIVQKTLLSTKGLSDRLSRNQGDEGPQRARIREPMQKIVVFQQDGSGSEKIKGVLKHGRDICITRTISIDGSLPPMIDETKQYFPEKIEADLILDFLKHPDLSYGLALICQEKGIPLVASGKRLQIRRIFTPPT